MPKGSGPVTSSTGHVGSPTSAFARPVRNVRANVSVSPGSTSSTSIATVWPAMARSSGMRDEDPVVAGAVTEVLDRSADRERRTAHRALRDLDAVGRRVLELVDGVEHDRRGPDADADHQDPCPTGDRSRDRERTILRLAPPEGDCSEHEAEHRADRADHEQDRDPRDRESDDSEHHRGRGDAVSLRVRERRRRPRRRSRRAAAERIDEADAARAHVGRPGGAVVEPVLVAPPRIGEPVRR